MMLAQIQIDSDLAAVDDKTLSTMRQERLAKGTKPPHPERVRIRNEALKAYAPRDRLYDLSLDEQVYLADPIPGMSRAAAKGIQAAREQGYFDTPAGQRMWASSVSRLWYRILATDQKQVSWQERMG